MINDNVRVECDDHPFPAHVDTSPGAPRWNGFVVPTFSADVVEAMRQWFDLQAQTAPAHGLVDTITWDGDVAVVHNDHGDGDVDDERYAPDEHGRYAIGACAWTWSIVDDSDDERCTVCGRTIAEDTRLVRHGVDCLDDASSDDEPDVDDGMSPGGMHASEFNAEHAENTRASSSPRRRPRGPRRY